ncbi:MAG TPA: hypothetical protein VNI01_02780, partial [Elusimicrobiota bacterium]|nr:hypothetical protein [Elusimicrobiota bacterium]
PEPQPQPKPAPQQAAAAAKAAPAQGAAPSSAAVPPAEAPKREPSALDLPKTRQFHSPSMSPNAPPAEKPPTPKSAPKPAEKPRAQTPAAQKAEDLRVAPTVPPPPPPKKPAAAGRFPRPRLVPALLVAALAFAVGGYLAFRWRQRTPERTLIKAAGEYLAALRSRDSGKAYAMLSAEARAAATAGEFQQVQDPADWDFSQPMPAHIKADWARVRYKLSVGSAPPKDDYLTFVREDGEWRRAYWWTLVPKLEDALAAGDAARATTLARQAFAIDPHDALAQSYVCEADFARQDYPEAEKDCLNALDLNKFYPSEFGDAALRRVHAILADAYKNHLGRPNDAERELVDLLALPGASAEERCDAYAALAESRYLHRDFPGALAGLQSCSVVCVQPDQRSFCERNLRILSGGAGQDAIPIVQNFPVDAQHTSLLEWRNDLSDEIFHKLRTDRERAAYTRSEERWLASYIGGSTYKVSLFNRKGQAVLAAEADLWNRKVKVDFNVQ